MQESSYKKLFNSAPVPLIVTDQKGTIKLANEQADALLHDKSTPLEGSRFTDFIDQSFLKGYFYDKSNCSFEDFLEAYQTQPNHRVKNKEEITLYADIKAVTFVEENEEFYIWTFDPIEITKKLTYKLSERVKEQQSILNVIEHCFQSQDIHATLQLCLQPIREGMQFPEATEVRITLTTGEVFATGKFKKTQWCLQSDIRTENEHYGYLEVCYRYKVPDNGGKIFFYEEERLVRFQGIIIGTIIKHWYNTKRINEAVVNAQEEERYQLAMELHDNVQQILTAASLNVAFLEDIGSDETSKTVAHNLKRSISEAIEELRRLSQQLAPSVDSTLSLAEKIHSLTRSMSVNGRLKVKINVDPDIVLNETVQLGFYRIIQEQLTNIIKYAMTPEVEISIKVYGPSIILSIADEGIGFDVSSKKEGIGFENIRRRTAFMNGSLDITSIPGRGTRVNVQVPITSND